MTRKWQWFILIGVALVGILFGSFFDLQLSQNIYTPGNWFGIGMSAFGATPVYICIAALGVGYIIYALKKDTAVWLKVILWILAIGCFLGATYFQADMILSYNAFNIEDKWYIGYPVGLVVSGIGAVIGYFVFKHVEGKQALIAMIAMPVVLVVSVLCVDIVKNIMVRPRFRFLQGYGFEQNFCQWWERGANLKDFIASCGPTKLDPTGHMEEAEFLKILKEDFRSFPSGHTMTTTCLIPFLVFLPKIDERYAKYESYFFFGGMIWAMLMGFSRILVGAHFLSDVSFGMLIAGIVGSIVDHSMLASKTKNEKILEKIEEKEMEEGIKE